jgi:glutathione-regulated potassium-efflux system protein KefB
VIDLRGLDLVLAERELFESAVVMGKAALRASGIERGEVERVEREYRMRDCERLERQQETGDIRAGWETSFGEDRPLPDQEATPA